MSLGEGFALAVLGFFILGGSSLIIAIVNIVSKNWRKVRENEALMRLKQSMVERGLSVEEIERVLNAGTRSQNASKE